MKPEYPAYMNAELKHGNKMDPTALAIMKKSKAMFLTLQGYISKV